METQTNYLTSKDTQSPLARGFDQVLGTYPFNLAHDASDMPLHEAFTWVQNILSDGLHAPLLGFDTSIKYDNKHINTLAQLVQQIANSEPYRLRGEIPSQYLRSWQELQGKVLIEALAPEIERVAGDVLTNVHASRTRIGDILEKGGTMKYVKAGLAAGSFGIMGLFQYRFMESLLQAIAQSDINQGKTGSIVQLVQNHGALAGTGFAWSILTTCLFAYLVKTGFETHLSDKLMGTKRTMKKTLSALGCAALLGIEMTGSFARITIGTDLKEQVIQMREGLQGATKGNATIFTALATQTNAVGDSYAQEGQLMYEAEANRGGVGPFAAAKQAAYLPKSNLDAAKYNSAGLQPKVDALFAELQRYTDAMVVVQSQNDIKVPPSSTELSAPGTIYDAGYHFMKTGNKLGDDSAQMVNQLLEDHNLVDPSFTQVLADLVFDAGKKLHPADVNALRAELNKKIEATGTNVDAISSQLDGTISTIDTFMQDMVKSANIAYPNSPSSYTPKQKPPKIDTSSLKRALDSTKTPVTVLDPFGVWGKFIKLSSDGTIPLSYTLALLLRILLVEVILLAIGIQRVYQTHKSLSTPGARFEDLARETDGQYLRILSQAERLTGGEAWQMLNGKALNREDLHTIVTTALTREASDTGLGNHMSVVDMNGSKVSSSNQRVRELLGAAFFGQYSAPEIRRIRDLDNALINWRVDITGESIQQDGTWLQRLRELGSSLKVKNSGHGEDEDFIDDQTLPLIVDDGKHRIRQGIHSILTGANPLKNVSNASQKRLANESIGQKSREWQNIQEGINALIGEDRSLQAVVADIRSDSAHALYQAVKALDETGDTFGYYHEELKGLELFYAQLLGGMDEKTFFNQKEKYNRDVASALKKKLSMLGASGLLDSNQNKRVSEWISAPIGTILSVDVHNEIIRIFEGVAGEQYVIANILTSNPWNASKDINRALYEDGLANVNSKLQQAIDTQARIKRISRYTKVSGENVTELQIMGLRSAAAELKSYLETQSQ